MPTKIKFNKLEYTSSPNSNMRIAFYPINAPATEASPVIWGKMVNSSAGTTFIPAQQGDGSPPPPDRIRQQTFADDVTAIIRVFAGNRQKELGVAPLPGNVNRSSFNSTFTVSPQSSPSYTLRLGLTH